jgi:protein SCO1/2
MKNGLLLICFAVAAACSRPEPLEVLSTVPEFTLTSHTGREFRSAELAGRVWVANFIFTNCMGPCPRMTGQMRQVQLALADEKDARMVSFTVDPARDTPEVLAGYAKRHKAASSQWVFLTGPQDTLHQLKRNAFLLGDVNGQLDHSTRFALVDRRGRIRAFYDTTEPGAIKRIIRDAGRLLEEKA